MISSSSAGPHLGLFAGRESISITGWLTPGYYPIQKPHPPVWFPGAGSPESVVWAARHGYPYMNLGALLDFTESLRQVYIQTADEMGFKAGPQHFGYLLRCFVADTEDKAQQLGRHYLWTESHRNRGPVEHNDPPGYQSREAFESKLRGPAWGGPGRRVTYEDRQAYYNIVVGRPETVIKKLKYVIERLKPGYLFLWGNDGAMPHQEVMRSIELLGKEVAPAVKEIQLAETY